MVSIRRFRESDWPAVWPILRTTFEAGDTYAFSPDSTEYEIHRAWVEAPSATYVACAPDGQVLGTYFIKPNHPALGAHVCNCGYVVAPFAQGRGIAAAMCEHSQAEAVSMARCRAPSATCAWDTSMRWSCSRSCRHRQYPTTPAPHPQSRRRGFVIWSAIGAGRFRGLSDALHRPG